VRETLAELTGQVIDLLFAEPLDRVQARAIGASLARFDRAQPETLGRTQETLVCQLADLFPDQVAVLQPRLAAVLGEMAIGFFEQSRGVLLAEQGQIREALDAERMRMAGELDDYRQRLEDVVEERTGELISAVEYLEREITVRRRVGDALRQRNRELGLLNRASQVLTSTLDLDRVLRTVLEEVRRLLGVTACSVWLVEDTQELVCQQATGPASETVCGWRLAPGEGIAGWVADSGESLIVADARVDAHHFTGVEQRIGMELRSILTVPLRVKRGVIGVIQVLDTDVSRFDSADLTLLESLAAPAAIAVDNARLVEALRQRTVELLARNEELDAFAHTVAHDLQNPLGLIIGFSEALGEEYPTLSGEELRDYLGRIARSGRKMGDIIDELLLLAGVRRMEVEMAPLDMAAIVAEAQQRLIPMIEEYQAEVILPDAWPIALGYGPWVEEVWVNYVSNAIKYGGRPPRIELGAEVQSDGTVRFRIGDNGRGLTPDEISRLFIPFTRVNQVGSRGHGLGLSIVLRIVQKLGGQVDVDSEPGRGSVFYFTLPGVA